MPQRSPPTRGGHGGPPLQIRAHLQDRMTSLLAPYESDEALKLAKGLDSTVEKVLRTADFITRHTREENVRHRLLQSPRRH